MFLCSPRFALMVAVLVSLCLPTRAQDNRDDLLLFVWNDTLYAQSMTSADLIDTGRAVALDIPLPTQRYGNAFNHADRPLDAPPLDGDAFYQGVESADGQTFAYLALRPGTPDYRVVLVSGGAQTVALAGEVSPERGYLVPVGWADDGALMLLERHSLYTLPGEVRLWGLPPGADEPTPRYTLAVPNLVGNSAALHNGWVFVGFDVVGVGGFLVNLSSGQMARTNSGLALQWPPGSVFEIYPVEVVGVTTRAALTEWLAQPAPLVEESPTLVEPFLYWPLPDTARSITCYPDSAWTDQTHAVECPGLTVPREYIGHEGTDVGGRPNGLAVGTPVYAAAPGLVLQRQTGCADDDITCGDAYGNYVLLEHARPVGHDLTVWYTGYAHLQAVLAETNSYVRDLGLPIATSGMTGFGGAHLHFEVRWPRHPNPANWLDPWDASLSAGAFGLWVESGGVPVSAVGAFPPPTVLVCQTIDGNNIRQGPGTEYAVVTQSSAGTTYEVFQVQTLTSGSTPGDWYHIRWAGSAETGWLWADLMSTCAPPA